MRAHALFVLPRGIDETCKAGESDELRLGADAANGTSDGTRDLDQEESGHSEFYQESLISDAVMEEHLLPAELEESARTRTSRPESPCSNVDVKEEVDDGPDQ